MTNKVLYISGVIFISLGSSVGISAFVSWIVALLIEAGFLKGKTYLLYDSFDSWSYIVLGWTVWLTALLTVAIGLAMLIWQWERKEHAKRTTLFKTMSHMPQQQ